MDDFFIHDLYSHLTWPILILMAALLVLLLLIFLIRSNRR
jgi:hypothetical protein